MRNPRKSIDEQYALVIECRSSGLSDQQWCMQHDINPGTFYNWVKRLRKKACYEIPAATVTASTQVHCHCGNHHRSSQRSGCQRVSRQWVSEQNSLSQSSAYADAQALLPAQKLSRGSEDLQGRMSSLRVEPKLNSWGITEKKHLISGRCSCSYQTQANALTCTVMKFMCL